VRSFCLPILLLGAFLVGCIGESPEEAARSALGPAKDGDEEHRPGQPCLACHGADYSPGGRVFVLAGTIYDFASDSDDQGLEGATVHVEDAEGHKFDALTNRVGNFMVRVNTSVSEQQQFTKGRLSIPWELVYPLTVSVIIAGEDKSMESQIWREGSCAACHHGSEPGVDHIEKVWFSELVR
jgi:hypothetical protein